MYATQDKAAVDVDLWAWALSRDGCGVDVWYDLLSSSERNRASGMKSNALRWSFIAGRGRMRQILAGYNATDPAELQFEYGEKGKPALKNSDLQFNLSHTSDYVVLAVARGVHVGVDIEAARPIEPRLARRFFSPAENAALEKVQSPTEWNNTFFRIWTAKEAVSKALGLGLELDFRSFDIDSTAHCQTLSVTTKNEVRAPGALTCLRFPCLSGVYGCIAVVTDLSIALHRRHYG